MDGNGKSKRKGFRRLLTLVILIALWFTGAVGFVVRPVAFRVLQKASPDCTLGYYGNEAVANPAMGAVLLVSETRLRKLAEDFLGWKAWLIPPGLVPDRYAVSGTVQVKFKEDAESVPLPFVVRVTPDAISPILSARLPSDLFNKSLDFEGSFTSREKGHEYAMGHYKTVQQISFETAQLTSELSDKERKRPITRRVLSGYATGKVRFKVKENIGNASLSAKVRRMDLRCDMDFKKYVDGLSLSYKVTVPKLDADINNVAPLFEGRLTESLRGILEESMSRPKSIERLARKRLPLGLPLDLVLKLEVFKAPSE